MTPISGFVRQTSDRLSSAFSSTLDKITQIGSTRIVVGNIFSLSAKDAIDRRSNSTIFSDLYASSITTYSPQNFDPLTIKNPGPKTVNPEKEKKIFVKKFFSYYLAQMLSGSKYTSNQYLKFADQDSIKDEYSAKDVWEAFKKTPLWKNLTLPEKVKAVALYYLFGEVAKNFLEDFTNNFMDFFITHYSPKEGVSSLFINILQKINGFLSYFEHTSEVYAFANPRGGDFDAHLKADLAEGVLINALIDPQPGSPPLTPDDLFIKLNTLFLGQFLSKLRIKEALLNKLRWEFNGNLEKIIWGIPYIFFIILNIPLLILAYIFEGFINSSIKDALQGNHKFFNPFKRSIPSISDLIGKYVNEKLKQKFKEEVLTYLYKHVQDLEKNDLEEGDLPSRTDLSPAIRMKIKTIVPSLLKAIRLHGTGGNRDQMKKVLDPRGEKSIDERIRSSFESFSEEELLSLFTFLTRDDFIESVLDGTFKKLTNVLEKFTESQSSNTKDSPSQSVITVSELTERVKQAMKPILEKSIRDTIGFESSTGSHQVQRFLSSYKKQFLPHLQKILEIFQNPTSVETLHSALDLLDQHRNAMKKEHQKFKELFEISHPQALRQVNAKLTPISEAQNKAFQLLIKALKAQQNLYRERKKKEILEKLLEITKDPKEIKQFLNGCKEPFYKSLKSDLAKYTQSTKDLQAEDEQLTQASSFLKNSINDFRMNIIRISPGRYPVSEFCEQIRSHIPERYAKQLENPLELLASYDRTKDANLFNLAIKILKKEVQRVNSCLLEDILEARRKNIKEQRKKEILENLLEIREDSDESFSENLKNYLIECRETFPTELEQQERTIAFIEKITNQMTLARISPLTDAVEDYCNLIRSSIPIEYAEQLEYHLKALTFYDRTKNSPLFRKTMEKLKDNIQRIKNHLSEDMEQSKSKLSTETFAMRYELNNLIDLLNIDIFEDEVREHTDHSIRVLSEMKAGTSILKADQTVLITPTKAVASSLGLAASSLIFSASPPVALSTAALLGSADPVNDLTQKHLIQQIYPKTEEIVESGINLIFASDIYKLMKQTLAVIAIDELNKRK